MSGFTVVLAPSAEDDIAEAFHWYQTRNANAAKAFRTEVFDTIDALSQTPLSWPVDEEGNRKRLVRRFPYSVWFEVQGNTVTVLAVAHHRRKPGYWRS